MEIGVSGFCLAFGRETRIVQKLRSAVLISHPPVSAERGSATAKTKNEKMNDEMEEEKLKK